MNLTLLPADGASGPQLHDLAELVVENAAGGNRSTRVSTAPSALYGLYEQREHLSSLTLTIVYAVGLVLSAIFAPDPVAGFPPGSEGGTFSLSGILHLLFGALGFLAIAAAAFAHAAWSRSIGNRTRATVSIVLGILIMLGFVGGAALSSGPAGVVLLWIAVLAQLLWLALASSQIYAWTPHPLRSKRAE